MKALGIKILAICLLLPIGAYLYFHFGWTTYQDTTYSFTINHPISWKAIIDQNKTPNDLARKGWYYDTGIVSEHSGNTRKIGMTVIIYNPLDDSWKKWHNTLNESMRLSKIEKSHLSISGRQTTQYVLPGALYIGPVQYNGRNYYFMGDNNEDVKKMLSSFIFTN